MPKDNNSSSNTGSWLERHCTCSYHTNWLVLLGEFVVMVVLLVILILQLVHKPAYVPTIDGVDWKYTVEKHAWEDWDAQTGLVGITCENATPSAPFIFPCTHEGRNWRVFMHRGSITVHRSY
jgi:hypothetical protein